MVDITHAKATLDASAALIGRSIRIPDGTDDDVVADLEDQAAPHTAVGTDALGSPGHSSVRYE